MLCSWPRVDRPDQVRADAKRIVLTMLQSHARSGPCWMMRLTGPMLMSHPCSRVHEGKAQNRVQVGGEVERIQGEIAHEVVLPIDFHRVELGVGRCGTVERPIEDRDVQAREPGKKAAVGQIFVTAQDEVDIGASVPPGTARRACASPRSR